MVNAWRYLCLTLLCGLASIVHGQLIDNSTSFPAVGEGYSENIGFNWSLGGPNWSINTNNQVTPPFGPSLANSGTSGGVGFAGQGVAGNLNFNFAQGSNRSLVGSSQSLTTMSGYPGSFFSGEMRPFVTGVTPIVGSFSPAQESLTNFAAADQERKLSAIASANVARQNERLKTFLRRAERGEESGNIGMARGNYRLALSIADEPLRSMIRQKLNQGFSASNGKADK